MAADILIILLAVAFAVAVVFLFKKFSVLVLNAVTGLAVLFIMNYFQLPQMFGGSAITINLASLLICAFGGIPGAIILVILALLGVPL